MKSLIDRINADENVARLRIDATQAKQVGAISPVMATPAAFAAGLGAAAAGAGALAGGAAIGEAID